MKYVFGFIAGLLLGVIVAAAVVYFNPLTAGNSPANLPDQIRLNYSVSELRAPLFSHSGTLKLPQHPADVPLLWESSLRGTLLAGLATTVNDGDPAIATRVSVPSTASNPLLSGALVDDLWLVTVPGRGIFWLHTVSNQWPILRDSVVRVDALKQSWSSAGPYYPTVGPGAAGTGRAVGVAGEFTGLTGTVREQFEIDRYGVRGFEGVKGQIGLTLD